MIEFGATDYSGLSKTPSSMADPEKDTGWGTSTLLATNQLIYESDQIRL